MLSSPREEARPKRRRTCADRMRRALAERQRQRRGGDAAGKMALQLLVLLSAALAMMPPMPAISFPFRPARRPASSIDDDRGPTAYAMERGLEPLHYATSRPRQTPSWTRLVKDLKRPRMAEKARVLLEERVPPAAIEWLREAIDTDDLWRLRMTIRPGASDDDVGASVLAAVQAWEAERQHQTDGEPQPISETAETDQPDTKGSNP